MYVYNDSSPVVRIALHDSDDDVCESIQTCEVDIRIGMWRQYVKKLSGVEMGVKLSRA